MWVIRKNDVDMWSVGFWYQLDGQLTFYVYDQYEDEKQAEAKCHYLNGGASRSIDYLSERVERLTRQVEVTAEQLNRIHGRMP